MFRPVDQNHAVHRAHDLALIPGGDPSQRLAIDYHVAADSVRRWGLGMEHVVIREPRPDLVLPSTGPALSPSYPTNKSRIPSLTHSPHTPSTPSSYRAPRYRTTPKGTCLRRL